MTRLPDLSARKVAQTLKRVGYKEIKKEGSHLYMWNPEKLIHLCVPLHGGNLRRSLLRALLQHVGLKEKEFIDLL